GLSVFDPLRAPAGDGEVLIEPPLSRWPELIERNRKLAADRTLVIAGQNIAEAREQPSPLILIGHQPEFFHAGVWAKNVLGAHFAQRIGGEAWFLVVDNDTPDQMTLRWPAGEGARLHVEELALPWAGAGVSFEQQPSHSQENWQ